MKDKINLYKIVRSDWIDPDQLLSFEVIDPRHSITYIPGQKMTTIEPSFFFLSRQAAVKYWQRWVDTDLCFALDAQLWRCEAEHIFHPPLYVLPPDTSRLFRTFWRTYYSAQGEQLKNTRTDIRDLWEGLEPVPRGTVVAFTFSVEQRVDLPEFMCNE